MPKISFPDSPEDTYIRHTLMSPATPIGITAFMRYRKIFIKL